MSIFDSVRLNRPKGNRFDLSHDVKLSCDMGNLVPFLVEDCVPGDVFNLSTQSLIRFAPLVSPVMHRMSVYMHYFFVPNRLIYKDWEPFITGNSDVAVPPYFTGQTTVQQGSLGDYLGFPTGVLIPKLSALPFAAYQRIWRDYYRDQNLQGDIDTMLPSGPIPISSANDFFFRTRRRAWQHDYFTASLPFAQKGDAAQIPLVVGSNDVSVYGTGPINFGSVPDGAVTTAHDGANPNTVLHGPSASDLNVVGKSQRNSSNLVAATTDLQASAATINDLRKAFRLQEWLERNARGGTRYVEQILSHFGVKSSDARLDRPEFIGGTSQPVAVSEVLQTSSTDASSPQANMAGHGVSASSGKSLKYRCEEHGFIIGIMSVLPVTGYQQGLPRKYNKFDRLDYFWPSFAHLGEQAVLNQEVYMSGSGSGTDGKDLDTWGYVPRYAEYKFENSRVCGDFRTSLAFWHLGRIFASRPALNESFISCDPSSRVFAVQTGVQHLYCHLYNNVSAYRLMPKYGTPRF